MNGEPLRILVSAGGDEDVPVLVTETDGKPLDPAGAAWALVAEGAKPGSATSWREPADTQVVTESSLRIMCRVNSTIVDRGRFSVWVKILDGTRTVIREATGTLVLS